MSAQVWPHIPHEQLIKEEEDSLAAELEWLLEALQDALPSLKSGLEECLALITPQEPGTTLALSTHRSETIKGVVTRVGTRIVKGDIQIRLPSLPAPRSLPSYPLRISSPLPLPQLSALLTFLNQALDIIDISTWTGDPKNGPFISGQLRLLGDIINEAQAIMKGGEEVVGGKWWEDDFNGDETDLNMPLYPSLSPHITLTPSSLLLTVRTLVPSPAASAPGTNGTSTPSSTSGPSLTGLSLRTRLTQILAPTPAPTHDEADRTFLYRGGEVKVRDKVRVEAQDPSLMAVGAKLSAVGREVEAWRGKMAIVMGEEI
ncbi:MAG: hypothetical protein LQ349_000180 [Xanthoria aureola]|nr:MAG: hypothetical protein LQ349_000180 [Xanthoria aureola]